MFRTVLSRRRREDARVDAMLDAIRLSERYILDPTWQLQTVHDDTAALPLSLVTLMVVIP